MVREGIRMCALAVELLAGHLGDAIIASICAVRIAMMRLIRGTGHCSQQTFREEQIVGNVCT